MDRAAYWRPTGQRKYVIRFLSSSALHHRFVYKCDFNQFGINRKLHRWSRATSSDIQEATPTARRRGRFCNLCWFEGKRLLAPKSRDMSILNWLQYVRKFSVTNWKAPRLLFVTDELTTFSILSTGVIERTLNEALFSLSQFKPVGGY